MATAVREALTTARTTTLRSQERSDALGVTSDT